MIDGEFQGSFAGTAVFAARLATIEHYIGDLMNSWGKVLVEDNRRGVLAGLDKNSRPVQRTHYRWGVTQAGVDRPTYVKFVPNPNGGNWKTNVSGGHAEGFKPGPSANLSTKDYKRLTGPPLAPRGMASRIISNYTVAPIMGDNNEFGVEGGWDDVVSKKGVPFLKFHFNGTGRNAGGQYLWLASTVNHRIKANLPRRNMNGLRDWGMARAKAALNTWMKEIMTEQAAYWEHAKHVPQFFRLGQRRSKRANP